MHGARGKIPIEEIEIVSLSEKHSWMLPVFKSFEKELVQFLADDALDNQKKKISRTHLWIHRPTGKLMGYITLLTDKIKLHPEMMKKFTEKGIRYKSLPALKIGRICVHDDFLRKGIGTHMIDWAISVTRKVNEFAGCRFITLEAKRYDDKEKDPVHFYRKNGFETYAKAEKGARPMYKDIYKLLE